MYKYLIEEYKELKDYYPKEKWLKKFSDAYVKVFTDDRIFINFFEPTEDNFEKKMQFMIERLETGKSSIDIEEIVKIPDGLWD